MALTCCEHQPCVAIALVLQLQVLGGQEEDGDFERDNVGDYDNVDDVLRGIHSIQMKY